MCTVLLAPLNTPISQLLKKCYILDNKFTNFIIQYLKSNFVNRYCCCSTLISNSYVAGVCWRSIRSSLLQLAGTGCSVSLSSYITGPSEVLSVKPTSKIIIFQRLVKGLSLNLPSITGMKHHSSCMHKATQRKQQL